MGILGERFFKLSNAMFCYHLTPVQFTVYSCLVSSAGQKPCAYFVIISAQDSAYRFLSSLFFSLALPRLSGCLQQEFPELSYGTHPSAGQAAPQTELTYQTGTRSYRPCQK